MLIYFFKLICKYISSNLVLILNACYYIKKLNYELFSSSDSSSLSSAGASDDLVKLSINLNIIDLIVISVLILLFCLMPMLKRTLLGDSARSDKLIIDTYLTSFLNRGKFKVTLLDNKSILIADDTE